MNDAQPETLPRRVRRRNRGRTLGLTFSLVLIMLATTVAVMVVALKSRPLHLPVWAVVEAEGRVNQALAAGGAPGVVVAVEGVAVRIEEDWVPRFEFTGLRLQSPDGRGLASLPDVRLTLAPAPLLRGELRPQSLRISGGEITLRRFADGRLDLDFGVATETAAPASLAEVLDAAERAFETPVLSELTQVETDAMTLVLDDLRARRVWTVGDGRIVLANRRDDLALDLSFGLLGEAGDPAQARLTFITDKSSSAARLVARIDNVAAPDLAAQSPALAWLGVIEAPISGQMSAGVDPDGSFAGLTAKLDIGAGALRPSPDAKPVGFDRAGLTLVLDMASEKITFQDLVVESPSLRLSARGHSYLPGVATGLPREFLTQISITELSLDPEGLFQEPARFSSGAIETRLVLNPFRLDIGQAALVDGETRLLARGFAAVEPGGWALGVDMEANILSHDRLLALWPLGAVPKTRDWVAQNVQEGTLFNVAAGLRARPAVEPALSLAYEFAGADVRFLRSLPPIQQGFGYSTIIDKTYTVVLDRGQVTPPKGGAIDVAGSVFRVPDITLKPATAEVTLRTDSSVTAALSLLDEPPFNFLSKAGFPVDVADGRAQTEAVLTFPLLPRLMPGDVDYVVNGTLSDVSSDKLVKGRVLTADRLNLIADRKQMTISGPGRLGQAPFRAAWTQPFGPEAQGRSWVEGTVDLSAASLAEFAVNLPDGMVTGQGTATMRIDLKKGETGTFRLASDLAGVALSLPAVGLQKPQQAKALFELAGRLGSPASIDRLLLESGPVKAEGKVSLQREGGLDVAAFSRVTSGSWLDVAVDLIGKGPGRPIEVAVRKGRLDLRDLPDGASGGQGSGVLLNVALDLLQVTESQSLTGLRGEFTTAGGLTGDFWAMLNGQAVVNGSTVPTPRGTAVRIRSDDAGGVIAAAGIFRKARGGVLDLTLRPRGQPGTYDGRAVVSNIQVHDAPVLAELLGAVSVVGLLEQLNNEGLSFSAGQADFVTSPDGVEVLQGAAVGASLGVSMSGRYRSSNGALDMQGVFSPIYLLNSIGSFLTRPGEGLFGFNYTLRGTASDPQISVNPLSILTPGMFREIFRSAPPQQGGQP